MTTPGKTAAPRLEDDVELLANLTELERALVRAARRGEALSGGDWMPLDELATTEDPRRVVRAELIRELLLGRRGELDPRGIRIGDVRVTGALNLRFVHASTALQVVCSTFDMPCDLYYARFPHLVLDGSRLVELTADGLQVDGSVFLRDGFQAISSRKQAAVRLFWARIQGALEMDGAELTNTTGPALAAEGLQVDGSVFLREGFNATGAGEAGAVRLLGARIQGALEMDSAELTNTTGPALAADRLQVRGSVFLRNGFKATGATEAGAVRLLGAQLGRLDMDGAELINTTGSALIADGLQVDGSVFLRDGFKATSAGELATVRLRRAHIRGQLSMRAAAINKKDNGLVLDLEGVSVGSVLPLFVRLR